MTIEFQEALAAVGKLPEDDRAYLGEMLVSSALPTIQYTEEQIASIEAGIVDADAGRFADPADVEALFAKYR